MSTHENEIIEKFRRLDADARRRVKSRIAQEFENHGRQSDGPAGGSLEVWLAEATSLRKEMGATYGKLTNSTADLIRDGREERLNDIMDRY